MKGDMKMFLYVWFFILGAVIGSFFQVCKDRLPLGLDIVKGRSFCFDCLHPLQWFDLIPIVSYVMLKGRCLYCHHRISLFYPIFEMMSGFLLVLLVYYESQMIKTILLFLLIMDFITISLIDRQWQIIPDEMIILEIFIVLGLMPYSDVSLWERLIGILIISMPLLLLNFWIPDSFGGGDIKLLMVNGFMLGYIKIILAFTIAVLLGGIYASYLLFYKKTHRHHHIAFAGFLCVGILISLFFGEYILYFYSYLFI